LVICALAEGARRTTEISSRQPMAGRKCMLAMLDELLGILIGCGVGCVECAGWHSHGRESDAIIDGTRSPWNGDEANLEGEA